MADFNQAAEVLERFGNMFAGLLDASAALKELGGIDAHAKSLTAQVANLTDQAADEQAELDRLSAAVGAAAVAYDDECKKAERELAEYRADAQAQADALIATAQVEATQITARAKLAADDQIAAAGATVANLVAKADDMNATMKQAADARDAALLELADLTHKIEAARATVKQMIGG
jgi:chromosome segregation ATPase